MTSSPAANRSWYLPSRTYASPGVQHPAIGPIEFDYETLLTPTEDQRLVVFTAPPGTPTADYLELLRVVGHETFPG